MNRIILLLAFLFTPQFALAEETPTATATATVTNTATATPTSTATPTITPTPTITLTPTPAWERLSGDSTREMHSIVMATVKATAMPTAYATPQVSKGIPLRYLDIVNGLDCAIACSLDGGNANNYAVPAQSVWAPPLAELKMHVSKGVNCRSEAACSTGSLYISGGY